MREERRNDRARFPAVGRGELAECIGRVLSEGCRERKSKENEEGERGERSKSSFFPFRGGPKFVILPSLSSSPSGLQVDPSE